MKSILEKFGFKKMDEMEKNIVLKAQRNALAYVIVLLLGMSFYESYKVNTYHVQYDSSSVFLLMSTSLVLMFSQMFYQRQAVKGDDEYRSPLGKIILGIVIIAAIIISIGSWLVVIGE